MPGAQRLHRRFLGGKPAREVRDRIAPARGVRDFAFGEDASEKPVTVARDRGRDAVDFGGIHTDADNIGGHDRPPSA